MQLRLRARASSLHVQSCESRRALGASSSDSLRLDCNAFLSGRRVYDVAAVPEARAVLLIILTQPLQASPALRIGSSSKLLSLRLRMFHVIPQSRCRSDLAFKGAAVEGLEPELAGLLTPDPRPKALGAVPRHRSCWVANSSRALRQRPITSSHRVRKIKPDDPKMINSEGELKLARQPSRCHCI